MPRGTGWVSKCNDGVVEATIALQNLSPDFKEIKEPFTDEMVKVVAEYNYNQGLITGYRNAIEWGKPKKRSKKEEPS